MSRSRRACVALGLLLLAAASALLAVWLKREPAPSLVNRLWPIDLGKPAGLLIDRRLAALDGDPAACRALVQRSGLEASIIPDAQSGDSCGWRNGVRLAKSGDSRVGVEQITCGMAAAVTLWLAHEVQPRANALLGSPVVSIQHRGSFACRNIRGSPARAHVRSEHARANALDIAGFTLKDGRQISVLRHWSGDGPEARFLREVLGASCKLFRVAIGPAYNAAHRDHFHLDRGAYRTCR